MRTIKQSKALKYLEFVLIFGILTSDNKAFVRWKSNKDSNIENAETAQKGLLPIYRYLTRSLICPRNSTHALILLQISRLVHSKSSSPF